MAKKAGIPKITIVRGLVRFFQVNHFGFYQRKQSEKLLVEGSMESFLSSYCDWVSGKGFTETIPWDPESHKNRTEVYCKDTGSDSATGDFLLVLWRRFGDDSGKVTGIKASAKVGDNTSDSVKIEAEAEGEPTILGQPMYYWFIPEHNLIATIDFAHSSAATKDVCDYLRRCIVNRIDHPRKEIVTERNENNDLVKRMRFKAPDGGVMAPAINVNSAELRSENAHAAALSKRITHLVVRDTISAEVLSAEGQNDPLISLFWRVKKPKVLSGIKKVYKRIEFIEEVALTPPEVKSILETHSSENLVGSEGNGWNDIGFREGGGRGVKWFSSYISKEEIFLRKLPDTSNYYTAEEMLRRIKKDRNELLEQVLEAQGGSEEKSA